ncbi:inclusion body family protein [Xenorhabdus bovienii]|uniref:AidA/PixA family protein n=1 Tax=Xenorhabdus bovienii TaxID=40576 RepID=UPI0023B228F6|nr:AidA/PixA family protein [Xenorhabdus bovienii]MDE9445230.1 inclusion body family protein [Xenorhabdus bovienii]
MKMIDILMAIRTEDIINDYGKLSKDINKPVSLHPSVVYDKYIRILPEDEKVVSIDDVGDIAGREHTLINIHPKKTCAR